MILWIFLCNILLFCSPLEAKSDVASKSATKLQKYIKPVIGLVLGGAVLCIGYIVTGRSHLEGDLDIGVSPGNFQLSEGTEGRERGSDGVKLCDGSTDKSTKTKETNSSDHEMSPQDRLRVSISQIGNKGQGSQDPVSDDDEVNNLRIDRNLKPSSKTVSSLWSPVHLDSVQQATYFNKPTFLGVEESIENIFLKNVLEKDQETYDQRVDLRYHLRSIKSDESEEGQDQEGNSETMDYPSSEEDSPLIKNNSGAL